MTHLGSLFNVWLVHSTISELWAYMQCAVPFAVSGPMLVGNPNLGTISLSRHQATFDALSVQVGKASTNPENVHIKTSR